MDRELLEQRKQMLTELVHDKSYVPMKREGDRHAFKYPQSYAGRVAGSVR